MNYLIKIIYYKPIAYHINVYTKSSVGTACLTIITMLGFIVTCNSLRDGYSDDPD